MGHAKACNCFSKICKAKIEFLTNTRMTINFEKKKKKSSVYSQENTFVGVFFDKVAGFQA